MTASTIPAHLPAVIAHRGASGDAPENTLAAMNLAADQGASCVEIDVSISADGVPFVHHDDTLDRCTTGSGLLCEHSAQELDRLDASKATPEFAGEPLPRLSALIELLDARGLGLNLEIKPRKGLEEATVEAICQQIEASWPSHLSLVFSSFSSASLSYAQQRLPQIARALLVGGIPDDWQSLVATYGCQNIHCAANTLTAERAMQLRESGIGVYCYTVNDVEQARQLLEFGAHGVFTDYPGQLLNSLEA